MARPTINHRSVHSERAQWSWHQVSALWEQQRGTTASDYATQVRKLPARIQTNGLGQALAFLFSKSKGDAKTAAGQLLLQLAERMAGVLGRTNKRTPTPPEVMRTLVELSPDQYRRCTHELLVTAEWLKRFVEGLFEKDGQ